MLTVFLKLCAGILLDRLLGEPRRLHPLIGFGHWAMWLERRCRALIGEGVLAGSVAWCIAILPLVALAVVVRQSHPAASWAVDIALLYFALGGRSLVEHATAIANPLAAANLDEARVRLARIVSRDTATLDTAGVARASCESVLENGNDAVFGALFWFILLGGPGALLFRLANTLDAMWGYRTSRYLRFGRIAARADDALGWIPARLTALTYASLGHTRHAIECWRTQAVRWKSPNAGPVMAAGAGALGIEIGGPARYHGHEEQRPTLGRGPAPDATAVLAAIRLIRVGVFIWVAVIGFAAVAQFVLTGGAPR